MCVAHKEVNVALAEAGATRPRGGVRLRLVGGAGGAADSSPRRSAARVR